MTNKIKLEETYNLFYRILQNNITNNTNNINSKSNDTLLTNITQINNSNSSNSNLICPSYSNINSKADQISEANISLEILLIMMLLCISLGGGYFIKKKKIKYINEPLFATIIGAIAGALLSILENDKYINNITTGYVKFFLIILLPPIIFER
jgi:hypothetical protein